MHVEFGRKVRKDLKRLPPDIRANIRRSLEVKEFAANADIKTLNGAESWQRLRVGSYRIIFKDLTKPQLKELGATEKHGMLVLRVIHRRDLEKEVASLK